MLHLSIKAISENFTDIALNLLRFIIMKVSFISFGIFYPPGELTLLHRLRYNPFAVVHYSFMNHCIVAAAILARK